MLSKELKVGIVGFGGAGMAQYRHFESMKGCRVTAIFDSREGGLERALNLSKKLFVTHDFYRLLDHVDLVAVCSPDKTHADYIVQSLERGKHVISEKPLTDSLEGCRKILQAEKKATGCVAAVQHQMRFLPIHLKMRDVLKRGDLGKVFYLEGYYVHNLTQRAKLYDNWRFEDNATPLVYSGCHFVDLLRWLLQEEVVEVSGMANNIAFPEYPESDFNITLFRFKSGIIGKVITAFGAGRPQDHSVRIYGSDKSIENNLIFNKDRSYSVLYRPNLLRPGLGYGSGWYSKLRAIRQNLKTVLLGKMFEGLMRSHDRKHDEYSISGYPFRMYEHSMAVKASLLDFVDAIRTGCQPLCTLTESAKTVATCLAGVEAYRTGKTVPMDAFWLPEFSLEGKLPIVEETCVGSATNEHLYAWRKKLRQKI